MHARTFGHLPFSQMFVISKMIMSDSCVLLSEELFDDPCHKHGLTSCRIERVKCTDPPFCYMIGFSHHTHYLSISLDRKMCSNNPYHLSDTVRLVDDTDHFNYGLVQVYDVQNKTWMTVCSDDSTTQLTNIARVICNQHGRSYSTP